MKNIFILLFIFIFQSYRILAQKTLISGHVISQTTNSLIPQVTIRIGKDSTTTNAFGEFSISVDLHNNLELLVSHKDYQDFKQRLDTNFYIIKFKENKSHLDDVVVQSNIRSLIKRIIQKLDSNYYNESLHLKAVTHLKYTIDSNRNFQSNAYLDVYSSPYYLSESKQVKVESNETHLVENSTSPMPNWVEAYLIINSLDIAHTGYRPNYLSENGMNNYNYRIVGKELVDGKTNLHIEFYTVSTNPKERREEGYILVDSASLAITKARTIKYNIHHFGYIPKNKSVSEITYKKLNSHWIIYSINYNSQGIYQKLNHQSFIDLHVIQYDTTNTKTVAYKDRIQSKDITQNIKIVPKNNEQQ